MDDNDMFKIILLGDSMVGKTSLFFQYTENFFPESFMSTIGVEYKLKIIKINNVNYTFQIWDTAGQERFRSISRNFLKEADGVIFVYDITEKKTFQSIKDWIKLQEESSELGCKKIIVGNKCDLEDQRKVAKKNMTELCQQLNLYGEETSAKNGKNVDTIFEKLANLIVEDKQKNENKKDSKKKKGHIKITNSKDDPKKKKSCC